MIQGLKEIACSTIDLNREKLVSVSDEIHAHPEIGHHEYFASKLLSSELKAAGFGVKLGVAGMDTAFKATLQGKALGPGVALLAEYDALPEIGHACAHNIIGTSALGAALGLKAVMNQLNGQLLVLGCPAEEEVENAGGKVILVEHGVFDDVDAALLIHPHEYTYLHRANSHARGAIEIVFNSIRKADRRRQGDNALNAMLILFDAVNALRQQLTPDVKINGVITDGGGALGDYDYESKIPSRSAARFVLRAANRERLRDVINHLERCSQAAGAACGATVSMKHFRHPFEDMYNLPSACQAYKRNLEALGLSVRDIGHPNSPNLSDIGNVSHVVPTVYTFIGMGPLRGERTLNPHTVEFREAAKSDEGHETLIVAAKSLAMTAIDFFTNCELMSRMRQEFEQGHPTRSPQ
jgi:amidohydrolase